MTTILTTDRGTYDLSKRFDVYAYFCQNFGLKGDDLSLLERFMLIEHQRLEVENERLKAELDQCKIDQIEFLTQHPTYKLSKQLEAENKRLNETFGILDKMAIDSLKEIGERNWQYGVTRNPKY